MKTSAGPADDSPEPDQPDSQIPPPRPRRTHTRRALLASVGSLAGLLALGAAVADRLRPESPGPSPATLGASPSVPTSLAATPAAVAAPATHSTPTLSTGAAGSTQAAVVSATPTESAYGSVLPEPTGPTSGIEHVVVVTLENRSFDHFLGWLPGADGRQEGLTYLDHSGKRHSTWPLAPNYQGCGHIDPDHSYSGARIAYDSGKCDGWLKNARDDVFAIGYYTQRDLAFFGKHAPYWTAFDRYFPAIMAETLPNRIYLHAGQTDRIHNSLAMSSLPTIWDRLAQNGLTGRYYYADVPVLALWGSRYAPIGCPYSQFAADCAAGRLPNVAFVDPAFLQGSKGTPGDDHPHGDIRNGEAFLDAVYKAVVRGPAWSKTLLVINFDEWGGFFEHVAPPKGPVSYADRVAGNDGLRGFRVPCLAISPWSRRGFVSHEIIDHTSILRLIEWRWGLVPLAVRDGSANNLAASLDFAHPNLEAPQPDVGAGPFGSACPGTASRTPTAVSKAVSSTAFSWSGLRILAREHGWAV